MAWSSDKTLPEIEESLVVNFGQLRSAVHLRHFYQVEDKDCKLAVVEAALGGVVVYWMEEGFDYTGMAVEGEVVVFKDGEDMPREYQYSPVNDSDIATILQQLVHLDQALEWGVLTADEFRPQVEDRLRALRIAWREDWDMTFTWPDDPAAKRPTVNRAS